MKKFLPSIIIFLFSLIDSTNEYSKDILVGLFLWFPILFIVQGIIISNKKDLYVGLGTSAISVILIATFYNMGTTIIPAIIYTLLALTSFAFKTWVQTHVKK
jgi:hypothetical protein